MLSGNFYESNENFENLRIIKRAESRSDNFADAVDRLLSSEDFDALFDYVLGIKPNSDSETASKRDESVTDPWNGWNITSL